MSEVKKIFSSVSNSAKTEPDADLLPERLNFQLENIQFHIEIQRGDQSIIYCVASAISRAILKRAKCEMCPENSLVTETWKLELQILKTSGQGKILFLSCRGATFLNHLTSFI